MYICTVYLGAQRLSTANISICEYFLFRVGRTHFKSKGFGVKQREPCTEAAKNMYGL